MRPSSVSWTPCAAQHAKWLKVCNQLPWRQSIASLNLILSSNVWQQDHNGFTHQDPGLPGPHREQEGRRCTSVSAAGHQLPAVLLRSLHPQPRLCQRAGNFQASETAVAGHGAGCEALHSRASASGTGPATIRVASLT